MPYTNLSDFVQVLEKSGELKRIAHPVKAELEIAEIADRVMKAGGPALLFENVVGKNIPLLINAFGSMKRMSIALGVNDIEEIAKKISKLIQIQPPRTFKDKIQIAGELIKLAGLRHKIVSDGACHEVVQRERRQTKIAILWITTVIKLNYTKIIQKQPNSPIPKYLTIYPKAAATFI